MFLVLNIADLIADHPRSIINLQHCYAPDIMSNGLPPAKHRTSFKVRERERAGQQYFTLHQVIINWSI